MRDSVMGITERGSAASASIFFYRLRVLPLFFPLFLFSFYFPPTILPLLPRHLVLKKNKLAPGRLPQLQAFLPRPLPAPALVLRVRCDIVGAAHAVVEVQLGHEARVGFAEGAAAAEEREGCGGGVVRGVGGEEVGDDGGCGAGFAHCAGRQGLSDGGIFLWGERGGNEKGGGRAEKGVDRDGFGKGHGGYGRSN